VALSTSWDSTVKLWDYRTHTLLHQYKEHTDSVFASAFAPGDGRFFATAGADAQLVLYTASSSAVVPRGS
jgi:WD40 repeat protein